MSGQLAALCGLGFGAGLWLVADGLRRRGRPQRGGAVVALRRSGGRLWSVRAGAAVAAGGLVGWWTGWPVGGLLAAVGVWALPSVLAGARAAGRGLERLEAIAAWTESLRGTLQAAAGLEQAIQATAAGAPGPIRVQVTGLADALRAGVRLPDALQAFADDLDHPDVDRVVAALILAARGSARSLAEQLGALAEATREQAAARLRVHTEWATTRTSVRVIIAITLVMAIGQLVLNRDFLEPYDTAGGQVVLALVGIMFMAGFTWLARLSRIPAPPRVLAKAPDEAVVSR